MGRVQTDTFCSGAHEDISETQDPPLGLSSLSRDMLVVGSIFSRVQAPSTLAGLPEAAARCDKSFVLYSQGFTVTLSLKFMNRDRTQPLLLPTCGCLRITVSCSKFLSLFLACYSSCLNR